MGKRWLIACVGIVLLAALMIAVRGVALWAFICALVAFIIGSQVLVSWACNWDKDKDGG